MMRYPDFTDTALSIGLFAVLVVMLVLRLAI